MRGRLTDIVDLRGALNRQNLDDLLIELNDGLVKQLQEVLLLMYKDVLAVCEKYKIVPFLIGGSALGAVRHSGFIPWDDDLDIGMTRRDYNKFVKIFERELSDKYILNAPNVSQKPKTRFTKIYKRDTVFRSVADLEGSENGVFLDIFIIENVPSGCVNRTVRGGICNLLQFISGQVYIYENRNPVLKEMYSRAGKSNYAIRMIIGKIFSILNSSKWFELVDKTAQFRKTGIYGIVTGRKHYFGEIFESNVFFPPRYVRFCDIEAPIFNDYDTYLRNLYHNYMELPPEDKRERHYVVEMKL